MQPNQIRDFQREKENFIEKKQTSSRARTDRAVNSRWIKSGESFQKDHSEFIRKFRIYTEFDTDIDGALEFF